MKYLGGKQRLGKHLSPYLLKLWDARGTIIEEMNGKRLRIPKVNGYLEPFCGSLGVFKHMSKSLSEKGGATSIVGSDYHPDLIQMWKEVQEGSFEYPESISEEEFNNAKKLKSPNAMKSFIGFGMSFGGRYFGSYSHKYLGNKKEDFCAEMRNSLQRTSKMIQYPKVKFVQKDYSKLKPKNKFIYCDPPYESHKYPIKYRRDVKHYDVFDNDKFWEIMRDWSKTGNNLVLISEMNAPDDFVEIWNMEKYRSAAQSKKTRFKGNSETHYIEKVFIHESMLV